jgi:beta-lactamase regulating signal transducer with metallopeptidase domain
MTATLGIAMLGTIEMRAVAESSVVRIVDCLFAGTLIAVSASLISRASRRQNSSVRFAVWFAALVAIAASPFLTSILGSMMWSRGDSVPTGFARAAVTVPGSWALYVFGVWASVTAFLLVRLGVGLCHVQALRNALVPVDPAKLDVQVRETLNRRGRYSPVSLCTSERAQVPALIGFFHPVVVVPRWVLEELSAVELNQILLHELAHLRRGDGWTNLAQQLIKAVFFFHPAVWWIERKISLEREMACDDAVLAQIESPRAYAECLQRLAEKTFLRRSLALAQAVLGRVRQTSLRVSQILDGRNPRTAKHGWRAAFSLATLAMVCGLIALNEPHLIAFQDGNPVTSTAVVAPYALPPITLASFKTAGTATGFKATKSMAPMAALRSNPVRAIASRTDHAQTLATHPRFQPATQRTQPGSMLRLATMRRNEEHGERMVAAEDVYVMFEDCVYAPSGQPVYEIEVVHVTVLHPSISSMNNQIPHKEI